MHDPRSAPALLFLGDYYGTLAAARALHGAGVSVHLADEGPLNRTWASRSVDVRHRAPNPADASAFLRWLLDHGKKHPGAVLYPASDELVFLFAKHREELSEHFRLYLPPLATIFRLLNKQRLNEACVRTGVAIPTTYYPNSEDEFRETLNKLGDRPFLLKPKTQIQLRSGTKAEEFDKNEDPVASFRRFLAANPFGKELLDHDPDVRWPMVQEFLPNAAAAIYSLAGFMDENHEIPVARASRKVLQRPRKLGIGLCFEGAEVAPELLRRVGALCKDLGYYGPFELEFVEHEGEMLLIDFNPRNYSQMAFEIARGLPTPFLQYLAATEQRETLATAWNDAEGWNSDGEWVYTHRTLLALVEGAQVVEGATKQLSNERWGAWVREHKGHLVDAVRSQRDYGPVVVDAAKHVQYFLKHPRSFLRSFTR